MAVAKRKTGKYTILEEHILVGSTLRVKSKDWYDANSDENGEVTCGDCLCFNDRMTRFLGEYVTVSEVETLYSKPTIRIKEDNGKFCWTPEMFDYISS